MKKSDLQLKIGLGIADGSRAEVQEELNSIIKELGGILNKKFEIPVKADNIKSILSQLNKVSTEISTTSDSATGQIKTVNIGLKDLNGTASNLLVDILKLKEALSGGTSQSGVFTVKSVKTVNDYVSELKSAYSNIQKIQKAMSTTQTGTATNDFYQGEYNQALQDLSSLRAENSKYEQDLKVRQTIEQEELSLIKQKQIIEAKQTDDSTLKQREQSYKNLISLIDQYQSSFKALQTAENKFGSDSSAYETRQEFLLQYKDALNKVGISVNTTSDGVVELTSDQQKLVQSLNLSETQLDDLSQILNKTNTEFKELKMASDEQSLSKGISEAIAKYQQYYDLLYKIAKYRTAGVTDSDAGYIAATTEAESLKKELDALNPEIKKNQQYIKATEEATTNYSVKMSELDNNMHRVGESFGTFGKKIATVATNVLKYQLVWKVFNQVDDAIISSVKKIRELDTEMTNIQMVTGETDSQVQALTSSYSLLAEQLGVSTTKVMESSVEWLRQGKTIEETNELVKVSTMLSTIGMIDSVDASELLTSTLNGFGLAVSDAMGVLDSLTAVDMAYATSTEELAMALQYVSSLANSVGVSFDQLVGIITVGSERTRLSAETIGTAWKTILSRMTNVKLGNFLDEESGESLNNVEEVLGKFGITLRSSTNEWRNFGDVINDIGAKWSQLTSVEKSAIATQVAGVRQQNIFVATMDNYDDVLEATIVSENSAGTATEKYENYVESIDGKIGTLTATWENFINNLNQSETFGNIIDAGTGLINVLDFLTNKSHVVSIALGAIIPATLISLFSELTSKIKNVSVAAQGFQDILKTAAGNSLNLNYQIESLSKLGLSWNIINENGTEYIQLIDTITKQPLTTDINKMTKATDGLGVAIESSGRKLTSLQKISVGMSAAMGWISLATSLITIGITAWNSYKKKQEEVRQSILDMGDATDDTISSLDDYKDEIIVLKKELAAGNLTLEENLSKRSELLSIQDELISKYGEEASNLDLLALSVDGVTDAFYDMAKAQVEATYKSATWQESVKEAEEYMSDTSDKRLLAGTSTLFTGQIDEVSKMITDAGLSYKSEKGKVGYTITLMSGTNDTIPEYIEKLDTLYNAINDSGLKGTELFKKYISGISQSLQTDEYKQNLEILQKNTEYLAKYGDEYAKITAKIDEAKKGITTAKAAGDTTSIAKYSQELYQATNEAISKATAEGDSYLADYYDDYVLGYEKYLNFANLTTDTEVLSLIEEANKGSQTAVDSLAKVAKQAGITSEELSTLLSEFGYTAKDSGSFNLTSAKNTFYTLASQLTDLNDIVKTATDEMEKYGTITSSTQEKLAQFDSTNKTNYSQYLSVTPQGIQLDTSAVNAASKQTILSEQKALQTALGTYNIQAGTSDYTGVSSLIKAYTHLYAGTWKGITSEDLGTTSSTSSTDKALENSKFTVESLSDLDSALTKIDNDISDTEYNLKKAELLNNKDDTKKYTTQLIKQKEERKKILEDELSDVQNIKDNLSKEYPEFANVEMTDVGIATFKQNIQNQITTLENLSNATDDEDLKKTYSSRIQALETLSTSFDEYTDAYSTAVDKELELKKDVQDSDIDIINAKNDEHQLIIDDYNDELDALDELHDNGLISDTTYYKNCIALIDKYFKNREGYEAEFTQYLAKQVSDREKIITSEISSLNNELSMLQQRNSTLTNVASSTSKVSSLSNVSGDYWSFGLNNYDEQLTLIQRMITKYETLISERETYLKDNNVDELGIASDSTLNEYISSVQSLKNNIIDINKSAYNQEIDDMQNYLDKRLLYDDWGLDSEEATYERMLELTDQYYKSGKLSDKDYYNYRTEISDKLIELKKSEYEEEQDLAKENLENQKDALQDIIDLTINLIKAEKDEEKSRHEQRISDFEDEADKQKELLDKEADERDYQKGLTEKEKNVSDLEKKLATLRLDLSGKSNAQIKSAEQDLADAKESLEDYQYENSVDKQKEAIDDEVDLFTSKEQEKIDIINEYLDKTGQIYQDAISLINNNWNSLYNDLINWNREYGTGIDSDITDAWATAESALGAYGDTQLGVLQTMEDIANQIETINSSSFNMSSISSSLSPISPLGFNGTGESTQDTSYKDTISQMRSNSREWQRAAEDSEMDSVNKAEALAYYAQQNQILGKKIGLFYNASEGRWYTDSNMTIPAYATGGVTAQEGIAYLHKGEPILNAEQASNILNKLSIKSNNPGQDLFSLANSSSPNVTSTDNSFGEIMPITVQGNMDSSILPDISKIADKVVSAINSGIKNTGIKRSPKSYAL